jgi:hypothetical protein
MYNINQFRVLNFFGLTDNTRLTPDFDISILENKYIEIKRIKFDFYSPDNTVMVAEFLSSAYPAFTAGYYKLIPPYGLIPLDFISRFDRELRIKFTVNGLGLPFLESTSAAFNNRFDCDNLKVVIPHPFKSIEIKVNQFFPKEFTDTGSPGLINVNVKCMMEIYLHETNPLSKQARAVWSEPA